MNIINYWKGLQIQKNLFVYTYSTYSYKILVRVYGVAQQNSGPINQKRQGVVISSDVAQNKPAESRRYRKATPSFQETS